VIQGVVTSQAGSVKLPGVAIVVTDASAREVAQVLCGEDGGFKVELPAGIYRVSASLSGFVTMTRTAVVVAAHTVDLPFDLPIEGIAQSIDVVATNPVVRGDGMLSPVETIGSREMDQFAPSGGLQASLRLLASIIEVPGGMSIKGGRPAQAAVQLGPSSLVDTATGLSPLSLPDDAVDAVQVLPNPYAVEYGRFSSGLVVIQTRRAGDEWKIRLNNLDPSFRTKRGSPVNVYGIQWWGPRLEVGGPIIKDRLFIEQTAQYRYRSADVPSLAPDLLRTSHSFSSFTRIDANLSPRQTLVATGGTFPGVALQDTLGTFTPPAATIDLHAQAKEIAVTERALWTDSLFSETTVHAHAYGTDVLPQGSAPMELLPETTLGNFFNRQHRQTGTVQVIETLSGSRALPGGLHLFKIGVDLLRSGYDGWSISDPVLVERSDRTLARRLDFTGPTAQSIGSTDLAFFAQDRFQPNTRWYLEFGGRVDRDGVLGQFNVTPRVGTAVLLTPSGNAVLRGGFGLFYERTPSTAGTFEQFENVVETRFARDGLTPLGPAVAFTHTTSSLETPRSQTWDVGYDHRINGRWSFHVSVVDRRGTRELVLDPQQDGASGELRLSSTGRSHYQGAEVGVHFTHGAAADLNITYAHALARSDLNSFAYYYDTVLSPIVGTNAYAPAGADVPNRLMARGRLMPTPRWLLLGIFDWRTGLPYSTVDEYLDYVGPRNALRFPTYLRLETGIERRFKIFKFQPWIGVRIWNTLDSFLPTDVQSNIASPAFGSFYNSEYRQFRIQLRFER
jgi:TonB dependent receptor-like, beta-barrel/Carboxypeptidase regulatory-like domain